MQKSADNKSRQSTRMVKHRKPLAAFAADQICAISPLSERFVGLPISDPAVPVSLVFQLKL